MTNLLSIYNFPALFSVVGSDIKEVPTQLNKIFHTESWILGSLLFVSFLLLALAKRLEPNILNFSLKSFFTLGTPESVQKFETRFNSTGYILLAFNFIISLWVCLCLFGQQLGAIDNEKWVIYGLELSSWQLTFICLSMVLIIVVYNFIGLFITSFLSGEKNLMRIFIAQSWINLLFYGYLFFALGIIWLLNSSGAPYFFTTFIYLLSAYFATRFIKTLIAALLEGISWYYIILYLCTLEILPIIVVYHYVVGF